MATKAKDETKPPAEAQTSQKESEEQKAQREWDEERAAARSAQNITNPDHVPEQRPQAMFRNEGAKESELTQRLRKANALPEEQEPHDKAAYDRASSEAQMKKAAENSKSEGILAGVGVRSTKGPHEGRIFAVTRIVEHGSVADMMRTTLGTPEQLYNSPKEVEVTAIGDERDGERLVLNVEEHGLEKMNEEWRGSRFGRRH
jgi:hypothetical protein